jgi:hypothetical protein
MSIVLWVQNSALGEIRIDLPEFTHLSDDPV